MKKTLLLSLSLALMSACQNKIENVESAFYYWKSNQWGFSDQEKEICNKLQTQKLYLKTFEVDYSEELGAYPIAKTELRSWDLQNMEINSLVPTVYLKNIVFLKSSQAELDALADNINFLINKKLENVNKNQINEFQMDCDWTLKTKDNYFYFLQKLKSISGKKISATLRLYPYKYPEKMGVPPVDKLMLMCYNLINPIENPGKNSILDLDELSSYLKGAKAYPKHLDVALPVYSWAQVYQNERFSSVLYTNSKQIKKILKPDRAFWYSVKKDTLINNTFLRIGDKIKYEEINAEKINNAIVLLKKHIEFDKNTTVALFHLDQEQLNNFSHEELSAFYTRFSQ